MQRRIPQNRRWGRSQSKGKPPQNLRDTSNFGNIHSALYEIPYFPQNNHFNDALTSLLFSVNKTRFPSSQRMAPIVHSMGKGSGGRLTVFGGSFVQDCHSFHPHRDKRSHQVLLHSLGWLLGYVNFSTAVDFETNCEIGLALPVEPPKAHNLHREGLLRASRYRKRF
jgi:hypothetical protein